MFITDISIRRPVVSAVFSMILVVFGLFVFWKLPVRELPSGLQPPVVQVQVDYQGASAEIISSEIVEILYNEKNALSVPDTSIMYEGSKKFIYKIIENNIIKKTEVETGIRNSGNLEVLSGLNEGDKIIAEGLTKVRPGMKVKPIIKSQ